MFRPRAILLLPLLLLAGGVLPADPLRAAEPSSVAVRAGGQAGIGRLVFEWPDAPGYSLLQDGTVVDLRFGALGTLALDAVIARPPPNVVRVEEVRGGLRLHLQDGAQLRHFLQGSQVVVEIAGPQGFSAPRRPGRPAPVARGPSAPPVPERGPGQAAPGQAASGQAASGQAASGQAASGQAASGQAAPGSGAPALARREESVLAAIAALGAARPAEGLQPPAAASSPAAASVAASPAAPGAAPQEAGVAVPVAPPPIAARGEAPARREVAGRTEQPAPVEPRAAVAVPAPLPEPSPAAVSPVPLPSTPIPAPSQAADPPRGRPTAAQSGPFVLPFAADSHVAALVRADSLILVFDDPQRMRPETLRQLSEAFDSFEVLEVPGSTVLRQRVPARGLPKLRVTGDAWALWPAGSGPGAPLAAITPSYEAGQAGPGGAAPRLLLPAEGAGRVVAIPDPAGEGLLLVGLVSGPGAASPAPRPFEPFDILPTELGVALAVRSDAVTLRPTRGGFAVPLAHSGPLAIAPLPTPSVAQRLMDLPNEPLQALDQRRRATLSKLIMAEPQARGELRINLAQDMLALGLAAEAQGLAQMAVSEDPRLAGLPRALMVAGASALVAGRRDEAKPPLTDPRLPALEETRLWRALASLADTGLDREPVESIAELAATAPMLRSYPAAVRQRLLPMAARALAANGAPDAAASLLDAAPAEDAALPAMAYARARLAEARGDTEAALSDYDALSQARDSDMRARALGRAAELRLAGGGADAATTAAALAAGITAWRGDARELDRRLRAATLYQQAGRAELAVDLLDETESIFPEAAPQIAPVRQAAVFGRVTDPHLPPLEAARRLTEGMSSLPAGPALDAAALRVANRLAELDLHAQGAALLQRAAERSEAPAALRLRQAELLVAGGQGRTALDILQATAPSGAARPARRELVEARALVLAGDVGRAEEVLRRLGAAGAAPLAELLASRQDWAGAAQALAQHAGGVLPAAPAPLDEPQRQLLLRLAAFSALAGDEPRVAELRASYGPRMARGSMAEAFATLVAEAPRQGVPDLDRLRREVAMGDKLSEQLRSLR